MGSLLLNQPKRGAIVIHWYSIHLNLLKMSNKVEHSKRALIEAMEASLGVVTTACKKVGISRTTFYDYYKTDESFKKHIDEIDSVALDFAESQLHAQIMKGNTAATIFYLKTKGKKRGYIERTELDVSGYKQFEVEVVETDTDE